MEGVKSRKMVFGQLLLKISIYWRKIEQDELSHLSNLSRRGTQQSTGWTKCVELSYHTISLNKNCENSDINDNTCHVQDFRIYHARYKANNLQQGEDLCICQKRKKKTVIQHISYWPSWLTWAAYKVNNSGGNTAGTLDWIQMNGSLISHLVRNTKLEGKICSVCVLTCCFIKHIN